eukprot:15090440-Ditylum_brightwellii.AAC.1
MPLLALGIAHGCGPLFRPMMTMMEQQQQQALKTGLILLGSVSGGQASNLFALLAGGDAALSVTFTLFTTILGAVATPAIIGCLLGGGGGAVAVDVVGVLRSVMSLAIIPLLLGLSTSRIAPKFVENKIRPLCPIVGIIATLCLVTGAAAGSSKLLLSEPTTVGYAILVSTLLPIVGGLASLAIARPILHLKEHVTRTLVVETLSKSPTLAYVLALRHFGAGAAIVPAAAMVTLAVVGAAVASVWSMIPVPDREEVN